VRRAEIQDAARDHWLAFTNDDAPETDMSTVDFHFYSGWEAARDIGDMFVLSKFTVLPRQGGWVEQDYFEAQDLLTYLRGYTWAWHQNHPQEASDDASNPLNYERAGAITDPDDFIN